MITSKLIQSVFQLKLTPLNHLPHRQCSSAAAEYHPTPQPPALAAPEEASKHEPRPPKRPIHMYICMCRESLLSQPISPHLLLLTKLPQFYIQVGEFLFRKLWQGLPTETHKHTYMRITIGSIGTGAYSCDSQQHSTYMHPCLDITLHL